MTRARRRTAHLLLLVLATTLWAAGAGATKSGAPKLSGQQARVAQGGKVDLAASALTNAELAALRPRYEDLKPRIHSNSQ